jgi:hypothetical protein
MCLMDYLYLYGLGSYADADSCIQNLVQCCVTT